MGRKSKLKQTRKKTKEPKRPIAIEDFEDQKTTIPIDVIARARGQERQEEYLSDSDSDFERKPEKPPEDAKLPILKEYLKNSLHEHEKCWICHNKKAEMVVHKVCTTGIFKSCEACLKAFSELYEQTGDDEFKPSKKAFEFFVAEVDEKEELEDTTKTLKVHMQNHFRIGQDTKGLQSEKELQSLALAIGDAHDKRLDYKLPSLLEQEESCANSTSERLNLQNVEFLFGRSNSSAAERSLGLRFEKMDSKKGERLRCHLCKGSLACSQGKSLGCFFHFILFCSDVCLGKYMASMASECGRCFSAIHRKDIGKFCKRVAREVMFFCSQKCLEFRFRSSHGCTFCELDLQTSPTIVAVKGLPGGLRRLFCSHECLQAYLHKDDDRLIK